MSAIVKRLEKVYWALQSRIAPGVEFAQNEYARVVQAHVTAGTRWLDLGCGHQLWPEWIPGQQEAASRATLLVGLDPDADSIRHNRFLHHKVVGLQLPFRDQSFSLVTANMVFEHLEDPVQVLAEIRRVLTPDGLCIFHTVNARYWWTALGRNLPQFVKNLLVVFSEGRGAKDVYPTHYRVNVPAEIPTLASRAGLQAQQVIMLNTSSTGRIMLLGPFVVLELLWIRMTQRPALSHHRSNIIGIVKPSAGPVPPLAFAQPRQGDT